MTDSLNLIHFYWVCYMLVKQYPELDREAIERLASDKVAREAELSPTRIQQDPLMGEDDPTPRTYDPMP